MQLLKPCNKGNKMNCWISFYIQVLQQLSFLIDEQKVYAPNPLYSLANVTRRHVTKPDSHLDSVHARPEHKQLSIIT